MKVLWFSPVQIKDDLTSGGWVVSLARSIAKMKNIELHVAFRSDRNKIENQYIQNCNAWHIPSEEFSKLKLLLNNYSIRRINKDINNYFQEVIHRVNPDIIQIFGTESVLGEAILKTRVPFVFHIQCVYTIYHHKYFSGLSRSDVKKLSTLKQKLYKQTFINDHKNKRKVVEREALFYQKSKYFLGRTDWDRRCAKILSDGAEYYHCEEAMREIFFKKEWSKNFNQNKIQLVTVIGGALYKGLETIVEAAELLKDRLKINFEWNVLGLVEKQETVKICRRKYGSRFNDSVNIAGRFDSERIVEILCGSDIFVHPSHIENSSNSICEALLLGMPVIATYTGGTPSLIQNGVNGIMVQDGDPWSLAGAISDLHEKPVFAKELGRKAREIALVRHDPDRIADNLVEIYENILVREKESR